MMNKNKSRRWSLAMYALIIPVIAGSIWLSSCTQQPGVPESQQEIAISDAIKPTQKVMEKEEVDVMPSFLGGQEALMNYFQDGFTYPEELKADNVEGKVYLSFVVNEDGTLSEIEAMKSDDERLEAPAIRFVQDMPNWEPGMKDDVKVKMVLPLQYSMN